MKMFKESGKQLRKQFGNNIFGESITNVIKKNKINMAK